MKILYLLVVIYIGFIVSGCTSYHTQSVNSQAVKINQAHLCTSCQKCQCLKCKTGQKCSCNTCPQCLNKTKNPLAVSLYTNGVKPNGHYVVLGKETVSKYNKVGIKRQEAIIHDAMRSLAANIGGDAVVNIEHNNQTVTGTIIAFDSKTPERKG